MHKILFSFLIVCGSFVSSCKEGTDKISSSKFVEFTSFNQEIPLEGKAINTNIELTNPWRLFLNDSLLIITDKQNKDGILIFLDISDDFKYLGAVGREGQGPGEFLGLKKVAGNGAYLWVFDVVTRAISRINIDSALQINEYVPPIKYLLDQQVTNISVFNDSSFAVGYYAKKHRFSLINNRGDVLYSFLNYPELENKYGIDSITFSYGVKANLYQAKMLYNSKRKSLVLSYYFTGLIQIIDPQNGVFTKHLIGPDNNFPPQYVLSSDGRSFLDKDAKDGYIDLCLTDNYIYALYSGKTDRLDITSNQVFQFDWKGNPIRKYMLDHALVGFAVDEKNNKIYGIDFSDNPLIEFDLPEAENEKLHP